MDNFGTGGVFMRLNVMCCACGRKPGFISLGRTMWMVTWLFCVFGLPTVIAQDSTATVTIGVLERDVSLVQEVLANRSISNIELVPLKMRANDPKEEYTRLTQVHQTLHDRKVAIVVGPADDSIALATANRRIPYLVTSIENCANNNQFCLLPSPDEVAQAIVDMVMDFNVPNIAILYSDESAHAMRSFESETIIASARKHIEDMVALSGGKVKHNIMSKPAAEARSITSRHLNPNLSDRDLKLVLMQLAFRLQISNFVTLTGARLTGRILKMARYLTVLGVHYRWIVLNLGSEDFGFDVFKSLIANCTQINMVQDTLREPTMGRNVLEMRDAVQVIENIRQDARSGPVETSFIRKELRERNYTGLTGHIKFNQDGKREDYVLSLETFLFPKRDKVGEWKTQRETVFDSRIKWLEASTQDRDQQTLRITKAKVVVILERPFIMLKKDADKYEGNERYEGFSIDLIEEISKMLKFQYTIYEVPDGKFGARNSTGEWNGIIRELLIGNATMSVAPLSINAERERAVDFTKPFKTRWINVLMKKTRPETSYFQFLNPLDSKVWICVLLAIVVFALLLYFFETASKKLRGDAVMFDLSESLWFSLGAIAQGSTETTPVTVPGRILTSAWWFFSLILISSYTANLAAFLTVRKINAPISSVSELVSQNKIRYGTVKDSGITNFLRHSKIEVFAKMWAQMEEFEPNSMVNNSKEGYEKVKEGNYAFLWDSTVNKYEANQDCTLVEINPAFDMKGFGIGIPPGAPYLDDLTMAILNLSDTGKLAEIENRWWAVSSCSDEAPHPEETPELDLENVAGVFFVFVGGIMFSFLGWGVEHKIKYLRKRVKKQQEKKRGLAAHADTNSDNNSESKELRRLNYNTEYGNSEFYAVNMDDVPM
ncbi:glutamate receptor 1-like isoform X3 [Lineus longissimus]|uniref:glutamate receptor 1-like isoform X3 n=1 Tax=Lineus longissimus TaxID=88925 RepID=UPI00315CDA58